MRTALDIELEKYNFSLPVMGELSHHLRYHNNLKDVTIGWHCHLTEITAASASVLLETGAKVFLSECNPDTTCQAAVERMQNLGATVYLGPDSCNQVLAHRPSILSDTGLVLISTYLDLNLANEQQFVFAASEITTSGINALHARSNTALPVININGGNLKAHIENFHGVGDGVIDALFQLSSRLWSGRRVAVVGYGPVGKGVANYLRRNGCDVCVIEQDPTKKLIAHYDGYPVSSLLKELQTAQLLVTATGASAVLSEKEWQQAGDGLMVLNVGHWSSELDLPALSKLSVKERPINEHLHEFTLRDSEKRIYVATGGNPVNVVMLTGSPEPTLIHLTTEILCMNHLAGLQQAATTLATGEIPLPAEIERQASVLALRALQIHD